MGGRAAHEIRPPGGRLSVIALAGLPEIRPGDDLAVLLIEAIRGTEGALPLAEDDVLVVTQKVVSKAEGAIVDLTTIEPRPEAVAFASSAPTAASTLPTWAPKAATW